MRLKPKRREQSQPSGSAYQALAYSIFRLPGSSGGGAVVGVTSPDPGAGTSFVVHGLIQQLAGDPAHPVLRVDLAYVARSVASIEDLIEKITPTAQPTVSEICQAEATHTSTLGSAFWQSNLDNRRKAFEQLRQRFHYIVVDCPALRLSGDALGIASLLDGFVLVAEANRTTTYDVVETEQQIESAGGRVYGSILNKQTNPLPRWASWLR